MNHVVRNRLRIRRSAIGAVALLGFIGLVAHGEPPSHETVPASSASQRDQDAARNNEALRCEALPDAERAECEQRAFASEKPPSNPPPPQTTEEERASDDADVAASEAESDADVAGNQPARSTTRIRQATRDEVEDEDSAEDEANRDEQDKDAQRHEQHEESNSEADTLGPPGNE